MDRGHEATLVLRLQAGDESAFEEIYEHYCNPVRYYLRRLLDSRESAEDVGQEVWMKVLSGIRKLRQPCAFRAWLFRIARNEAFRLLRRRRDTSLDDESTDAMPSEEADETFTPEDGARLHAALGNLKTAHREVLVLRFLEEMSYEEIASVVGCPPGTVRSRIYYGKRALRAILEETYNV
ncbi:MAG: RNA polymerase sigma factor [Planctomycetota bacterium]|jgi:RNA polymerase sigma-70 factor (ECF subfamily)